MIKSAGKTSWSGRWERHEFAPPPHRTWKPRIFHHHRRPCRHYNRLTGYYLFMNNLSPEILSEIFLCVLPASQRSLFDNIRAVDPSAIHTKLCLVCRHWNEIAVTTPALWTSITFTTSSSCHTITDRRLHLSKSLPLDILLDVGNYPDKQARLRGDQGFQSLWRTSQRWRSFQIRGRCQRQADFLNWTPGGLPLLRELIVGVQFQNYQVTPNDVALAVYLPCLMKLTIQHLVRNFIRCERPAM